MVAQKTILFVCVAACFVAIASAQLSQCPSKVTSLARKLRSDLTKDVSDFTSELQKAGVNAADIQKFRNQAEETLNSLVKLVDPSNVSNLSNYSEAYMNLLQNQMKLYEMFTDLSQVSDLTGSYISLGSKINNLGMRFIMEAAKSCLTGVRQGQFEY